MGKAKGLSKEFFLIS